MLFNRSLKNLAGDIAENAIMHDYWLVLFARYFGKISFINKPLLDYRQHRGNNLGAIALQHLNILNGLKKAINNIRRAAIYRERYLPYQRQAKAFLDRTKSFKEAGAVKAFIELTPEKSSLQRKKIMLLNNISAGTFFDSIEMFFCL
jgi:hypothetical protein